MTKPKRTNRLVELQRSTIKKETRHPMINLHVLASGSSGNASIIEDPDSGLCIGIDAGICCRAYLERCDESGIDLNKLQALFITHEHTDHTKGLGVTLRGLRKRGITVPVFVERNVRNESTYIIDVENDFSLTDMNLGKTIHIEDFDIHPFRTSHDAVSSCGFRIECNGTALGFLTDSGFVTPEAHEALGRCNILAIESNHDIRMLESGPYPYRLKQRIASQVGHLSNLQAAEELDALRWSGLQSVVAMHISQKNNTYSLPKRLLGEVFAGDDCETPVCSAYQNLQVSVQGA